MAQVTCMNCGRPFNHVPGQTCCSACCVQGFQARRAGMLAVLEAARQEAKPKPASVRDAEAALASRRNPEDTARLFAEQEAAMLTKLTLGPRARRDLTRYR